MERLRRPVPVWMLLVGILVAASVATAIVVGPSYLGPKPDFSLRPDQTSQYVFAGFISYQSSLDFKIGVTSVNGFSGIVSFNAPAPAGLSVHVREQGGSNPVALLGRNDTVDVSVYASNFGNYTLTVTGSTGQLSHSVTLMVIAQTITFTANPDPIVIPSTGSVNGTMTLTGVNGFSGTVEPFVGGPGVLAQVHPSTVFLPFHGTASVTVTYANYNRGMCPLPGFVRITVATNEGYAGQDFNIVCS